MAEAGSQSLVGKDVGTQHGEFDALKEGLDQTFHPVIKLVVPQSLMTRDSGTCC